MKTTKNRAKKKSAGISLILFLITAGIIGLALTVYIGYRASISDRKLFSLGLLALFAGLLFESFRVSDNWRAVIGIFVGSYLLSFFTFLPGKREHHYNFENHIEMWPYFFLCFFALGFGIFHKDKVTTKLSEGITLLLSISLIYWAIDYGFTNYNWFSVSLLVIATLLSIFSIINALSHIHLSRTARLTLSVWSSIIMFAFAIDNIFRVFSNPDIENSEYLSDGFYIGLQYFLLGISAVYMMQNFMLLAAFLPSKNGNYKHDLKENKKDHIDRYSDQQVHIGHSLLCIVFAGTLYWANYTYHVLPRHTMIWLVFMTFPLILQLMTLINRQKNYR